MNISDAVSANFLQTAFLNEGLWKTTISERSRLTCATYTLACGIIVQALGEEWSERHIGRIKACDYFKANVQDHRELLRYMARATEFGELIYNLQGVGGFDERIASIRTDVHGIESGIAELFAGKFFRMANVLFQYVVVKKQQGENTPKNPDIEYVAGLCRWEACEVKCNIQKTELNERSIINILKSAKSQLPKGKAGAILIRVPENWIEDMATGARVIESAVKKFISVEKTTRVSSVFVFASATSLHDNDLMAQSFAVKEFRNEHCDKASGISIPASGTVAPNWRTLAALAKTELARANL
jgi:hypothetical protein